MTEISWRLRGDYFENCNCDILCPCIHNSRAVPTAGHCDVALVFHIEEGRWNTTVVDGLNFMIAAMTPGVMGDGGWKTAVYIDERAAAPQREALQNILSGKMGGPMARFMPLTAQFLGIRYVPITYRQEGKRRSVTVPNVIDCSVEGIQARGREDVLTLSHTAHPVSSTLALARGTGGTYSDHGMTWDNTGKNAHYAAFQWQWPA